MKRYKTGLVIGRFQPFHNGHAYLIEQALIRCDTVIIGIVSTNVENSDNPWSFHARKEMLDGFLMQEGRKEKVHKIIALEDTTDEAWTQSVLDQAKDAEVVIGNNDWVNQLLKNVGFDIVTLPYFKRYELEGQKIRMLMKGKKSWQSRVPKYIAEYITQYPAKF